ncbi:DNA repair exonuclease [Aureobasidium pullulans]|nr:DNA repair exonuclease [Aureobasidium pullulans]
MPATSAADTIRVMISTDNHVGYGERDPNRGNDSWETFDEIMTMARERDVDMVLLAGDLFHDNKPSRKAMYHVMQSLRKNCFGEKPCELEMLSDASEAFQGAFNHVNYEDPDINVAIPVFSIHGNHDDPTGDGHLASLDLLQMAGMVNYYGRTPESDKISIKPVLLQKGRTKLALYGMSNVRDERMFRTFRDQKVKFFQPGTQTGEWFNLMSVHQNHHAYTETGYLPENFLPSFMDLVIWGHEHECLINPRYNPEQTFHVMQPGSSVATSLMPGEAVPKHVAILSITGKEFKCDPIRLKTVRPFVMREIILQDDSHMKRLAMKDDNRTEVTRYLTTIVEDMIKEADQAWRDAQEEDAEEQTPQLPLIRLRVEYTAPEGGRFDCENPQRFSNRFLTKVANVNDVVQFHRKKTATSRKKEQPDMPEEAVLQQLTLDTVKVEKLVKEFLTAQSLTILPQNSFGDAVSQFVDKDDKHAMEAFVNESLASQLKHLLSGEVSIEDEDMQEAMETYKTQREELFSKGMLKRAVSKGKLKPKPANWDSDLDGEWAEQPAALIQSDNDAAEEEEEVVQPKAKATRGRGGKATGTTRKTAAATKKAAPAKKTTTRARKAPIEEESDEEEDDDDVIMLDDGEDDVPDVDDDEDDDDLFVKQAPKKRAPAKAAAKSTSKRAASPPKRKAPARSTAKAPTGRQTTLSFSQTPAPSQARATGARVGRKAPGPSEDEISDDDDAFEPPPTAARSAARRKF